MLAVMKTGNVYVPLDPKYPAARLKFMVQDAGIRIVISEAHLANIPHIVSSIVQQVDHFLQVDGSWREICRRCSAEPLCSPNTNAQDHQRVHSRARRSSIKDKDENRFSKEIAYVLYTSGSTGVPKGVCGTHCAMLNRFLWMWSEFPFRGTELACHKTSLNFVDSIFEVFGALGAGVPVLVVPEDA